MAPSLMLLNGNKPGAKYELQSPTIRLGRHPDCEVVIDVNAVSRFHAHLLREGDQYLIEDLQSRNGTFVNGKKIEGKVPLQDNDRVKICDTLFVYRGSGSSSRDIPLAKLGAEVRETEDENTTTVLTAIDAKRSAEMMVKVRPEAKLRAILEISSAVGQTLELDALFAKILESLFSIFPQADRAMIILRGPNDSLIPRAVKHRREEEDTVFFSKTIVRKAMAERMALLSADASSDERFSMSQSIADFRIRSVMCVPLLSKDQEPLGIIQIDTQSHNQRFEEDDLQILASVGTQASVAIENAQLHSDILNQERLKRELSFAKAVQACFLPKSKPAIAGYEFWAIYEAAGEVGGDYYDFIPLTNGLQAVVLGDVSGKGVPAALMMAKASSDTKVALLTSPDRLDHAMGLINNAICAAGVEDRFITMALCVLDTATHKMTIVNAGHMSPMIRRVDGAIAEPAGQAETGLPLGVMEDFDYVAVETELGPGEQVVLFSDGISEAMNADNKDYTMDRLRKRVSATNLSADQLGEAILRDVREHVAGHKQSDDISMVVFRRSAVES